MIISKRQIIATIEQSTMNVGVSTRTRKYIRDYYQTHNVPSMSGINNKELNDLIASDFLSAERLHRFKLKSGEIAEIRKSHDFYYIGVIRGRGDANAKFDVIAVQPAYKEPPEDVRKIRLQPGWGAE